MIGSFSRQYPRYALDEEIFTLLVWCLVVVFHESSNRTAYQITFVYFMFFTYVGHIVFEGITHS